MRPLIEKVFIGTGIEPVLNWFSSIALTTRAQAASYIEYISMYIYVKLLSRDKSTEIWLPALVFCCQKKTSYFVFLFFLLAGIVFTASAHDRPIASLTLGNARRLHHVSCFYSITHCNITSHLKELPCFYFIKH